MLSSVGAQSDAFVAALAEHFGLAPPDAPMLASIPVDALALADDPDRIVTQPVRFKLFFQPNGSEEGYAEVFLNVDAPAKRVEFNEKDTGYREPLLRALTSRPTPVEPHVS
ncbi:MAG: hypothetical protein HZA52_05935 [Planctomycetes bacterium]|nr:hypothetical protein [Planctomycetota bacterium]